MRLLLVTAVVACHAGTTTPSPWPGPGGADPVEDVVRADGAASAPKLAADGAPLEAARAEVAAEARGSDVAVPVAAADGSAAPPAAAGACAGARYCEDFEGYTVGAAPGGGWIARRGGGGTLAVDATRAFTGTKSLVSRAPVGSTATAMIARGMPALPVTGNDLFGRVMVWLAQVPSGGVHFHTVNAYGKLPDGTSADYDIGGMYGTFLTNYHPHDCYRGSKTAVPTGRWFCLQWQFDGSPDGKGGTRNEARYWVDGAPLDALTVVRFSSGCVDGTKTEWLAPAFDRIEVGWSNSQATPIAIEQWVDDFAVDAKPVPCPAR